MVCFGYYGKKIVEHEETTDYQAILDIAIDEMEERGETGYFIDFCDTKESGNEGGYESDMYVTGGNHCLLLYTGGMLNIIEI